MEATISCMLTRAQNNALHVLQVWQTRLKRYGIGWPIDSVPPTGVILTEEASTTVLANHVITCTSKCCECLNKPILPYLKVRVWKDDGLDTPVVFNGCTYLHGQLDLDMGNDIFEVLDDSSKVIRDGHINYDGLIKVNCVDTDIPCIGYLWHYRDKQHGLICYETDIESRVDAFNRMLQKTWDL